MINVYHPGKSNHWKVITLTNSPGYLIGKILLRMPFWFLPRLNMVLKSSVQFSKNAVSGELKLRIKINE